MSTKQKFRKDEYKAVLADLMTSDPETFSILAEGHNKITEFMNENSGLQQLIKSLQPMLENIRPVKEFMRPVLEAQEAIKEYVSFHLELSERISILPLNGWYLNIEFIDKLGESFITPLLRQENHELSLAFTEAIIALFEKDFTYIKDSVVNASPKRSKILESIFNLHIQSAYEASINLALAQADGICKDAFTVLTKDGKRKPTGFFNIENDKKVQTLSKSITAVENSLLLVLTNQLAGTDRNDYPLLKSNTTQLSDLNRHAIMHGETVDYGTYQNSVKAILLLYFIVQLRNFNEWSKAEKEIAG